MLGIVRRSDRLSCLRLAVFIPAALSVIVLSGCGGCGSEESGAFGGQSQEEFVKALKEKKQREQEADQAAMQPGKRPTAKGVAKAVQPQTPQPAETSGEARSVGSREPEKTRNANTESSDGPPPPLPPPLPPPADLTKWDEHDFHVARLISDRRLVDALAARASRPQKTDAEASMLIDLITVKPTGPAATDRRASGPRRDGAKPEDATMLARVAEALAANGTATARQALVAMIQAAIPVADAKAASEAAVEAVARRRAAWTDTLLLEIVFQPERFIGPAGGWASPDSLRQRVLTLLRGQESSEIREQMAIRLAQHSSQSSGHSAPAAIMGLLSEPVLANLPAQLVLYRAARLPQNQLVQFESHFAAWSRRALSRWLELPPEGDEPALDASQAVAAARLLWGDEFFSILDLRHRSIGALAEAPTLLALSATIPTDAMRKRLMRTLDRHYLDGPGVLRQATLAGGGVFDPALSLTVREVIRDNTRSSARPAVRPTAGRPTQPVTASRSPPNDEWETFVADLVRQQCRRYFQAGLAQMAAQRSRGVQAAAATRERPSDVQAVQQLSWPFPLHAGVETLVQYRIDRETISPSQRGPEAPLRLCYLRMEEKGRPSRPLSHYRRQLRNLTERRYSGGYWLFGRIDAEAGKVCFVDLFVLPAKAGIELAPEDEQQLTVELLAIQTTDLSDTLRTVSREP